MDWQELAAEFQSRDDWSGFTYIDFRTALEGAIVNIAVPGAGSAEREYVLSVYGEQIDWILYCMNECLLFFDKNLPVSEAVKKYENSMLSSVSKDNCIAGYINIFLYKFINMEINNLKAIVNNNDALTAKEAVDYFIATLVYPFHAKDNPGRFFTFRDAKEGAMQPGRNQSLENLADELFDAYKNDDKLQMFKTVFYLGTNFAGAKYRPLHRALSGLLVYDLGEFRNAFYENLPEIIKREGTVDFGGFA